MPKFRVPVRVSVAPVQTYIKHVTVEAATRKEAAELATHHERLSDLIHSPGWRAVGGRMGPVRPDLTTYDTYLDEHSLAEWGKAPS